MKTIFLASGRSSRMNPISDKCLLPFCGKPLFLHLLENARAGGLSDFIVVTNHENNTAIQNILSDANFPAQTVIQKDLDEGMAGGVLEGLRLVPRGKAAFVLGGNDYVETSAYTAVLTLGQKNDGALLAKRVKKYFPGGYLQTTGTHHIQKIVEKPGEGKEPSNLINIVLHYFRDAESLKNTLESFRPKKPAGDWYEQALDTLFQTGSYKAVPYNGVWQAIKYPWHVLGMTQTILSLQKKNISPKSTIAKSAHLNGEDIVIAPGAQIQDGACIEGPAYIGTNAIVGNNALIRQSIVGANSVVGYNTEVARSYLAPEVTTHIAYIGDSVVDEKVNFGAFSCTANLRLDQKNILVDIKGEKIDSQRTKLGAIIGKETQIGVHSMLMPGCKIQSCEHVAPGEIKK